MNDLWKMRSLPSRARAQYGNEKDGHGRGRGAMRMAMAGISIICIAGLGGCETPAGRAARLQAEVDQMVETYGPACQKLGYQENSDGWRQCILQLDNREQLRRYQTSPGTTTCFGHRGFFTCDTF